MKILITGSDGFSGSHFCVQAKEDGHQVLGTDINCWFVPEGLQVKNLDIRDQKTCQDLCRTFQPDVIIHTARAPGNLWQLEKDRATAYRINVLGARTLAQCSEELGATFVYLSTDWIFDGSKPAGQKYDEEDEACPLGYYGVTKWMAEQEIRRVTEKWLIIRPAHIYGFHAAALDPSFNKDMNIFSKTVWGNMWSSIQKGEKLPIPEDMYQTPVLVNHLVETILRLLEKGITGIFHLTDRDCHSRFDITRTVFESLGFESPLITKGDRMDFAESQGLPPDLENTLPLNSCLGVNKIEKALGVKMMTFQEGVARMKALLQNGT